MYTSMFREKAAHWVYHIFPLKDKLQVLVIKKSIYWGYFVIYKHLKFYTQLSRA